MVLDTDGNGQVSVERGKILEAAVGVRMEDVRRHRHNAVRAPLLGVAAEFDGRDKMPVRRRGEDRDLTGGFLDHDVEPAFAFVVGEGREFAGIGRTDQPVRARFDAEANLATQAFFVDFIVFRERRHDNYVDATPRCGHGFLLWIIGACDYESQRSNQSNAAACMGVSNLWPPG